MVKSKLDTNSNNEKFEQKEETLWSEIIPFFIGPVIFMVVIAIDLLYENIFMVFWIGYALLPLCDYLIAIDHSNLR